MILGKGSRYTNYDSKEVLKGGCQVQWGGD